MTFSYNNGVPATLDDPSIDQPDMLTNTQSINGILAVDHVTFNAANGGKHLQVTFSSENAAGAQVDPASTLYTGAGTASSVADLFYRNQNAIFRPNVIKAAGVFTTVLAASPGVISLDMGFNVVSIDKTAGIYTITFTANAIVGTTVIVLLSGTSAYTFAANTLTLTGAGALNGIKISFAMLQV